MHDDRNDDRRNDDRTVVTRPDPTVAVTAAVRVAVDALNDKLDERFRASESALTLARAELRDLLAMMDARITDKFSANTRLFEATLQTQREAQHLLKLSLDEANKATNEKIDRLTSRLDLGEGRLGGDDVTRQAIRQDVQATRAGWDSVRNLVFALIAMVLTATGIIVSILLRK